MNFDKTSNRAAMKGERFFFEFLFIFFSCNLLILDKAERLRQITAKERKKQKLNDVNLICQSVFE